MSSSSGNPYKIAWGNLAGVIIPSERQLIQEHLVEGGNGNKKKDDDDTMEE